MTGRDQSIIRLIICNTSVEAIFVNTPLRAPPSAPKALAPRCHPVRTGGLGPRRSVKQVSGKLRFEGCVTQHYTGR